MNSLPRYNNRLVFIAACMGMLLFGIELITLGSVASDLKLKFHLDEIASGTLFSILPLGILIGSVVFGPIADKFGYKWLLVFSCFGFFISFEGIATAQSLFWLKISIFFVGVFGGVINGAVNAVVADISKDSKTANLSLLGVFFGIGALGMPFILGLLREKYSFEIILQFTGLLIGIVNVFYVFIKFPLSKQAQGFPLKQSKYLFKESLLILIGFFLFCQSSYEALINNWTTSYLTGYHSIEKGQALYALSFSVAGLTLMRLLTGSIFRSVAPVRMLIISFLLLIMGDLILRFSNEYYFLVAGLFTIGMGLAGGFPIMLGIVGDQYRERLATAFSFVLLFALIGNILLNYLMGWIAKKWGIEQLSTIIFVELFFMLILSIFIYRKKTTDDGRRTTKGSEQMTVDI